MEDNDVKWCTLIHDLPCEVLLYILGMVSPYEDLNSCMLVCKQWYKTARDAANRKRSNFIRDVRSMNVTWTKHVEDAGPTIVARYAHSCCLHKNSMYVFGGCTATDTTFNDLWRFDLCRRQWIRPLAFGTYPTPKAFATFVPYKDVLVLFGGLTHPSPSALHQFHCYRLFNHLHFYEPLANHWVMVTTAVSPPPVAGHSATVHKNLMIVFGGRQVVNGQYRNGCNDIWVFDLKNLNWWKQETTEPKPPPMLHQMQIFIDDHHALVMGGCGGPNMILSDVWLLRIEHSSNSVWVWKKLTVRNPQNSSPHMLCHSACKVDSSVVVLGRDLHSGSNATIHLNPLIKIPAPVWVPPREENIPLFDMDGFQYQRNERTEEKRKLDVELCVNGKRGVLPNRGRRGSKVEGVSPGQLPGLVTPECSTAAVRLPSDDEHGSAHKNGPCKERESDMANSAELDIPSEDLTCRDCGRQKEASPKRFKTDDRDEGSPSSSTPPKPEAAVIVGGSSSSHLIEQCHCSITVSERTETPHSNDESPSCDSRKDLVIAHSASSGDNSPSSGASSYCSSAVHPPSSGAPSSAASVPAVEVLARSPAARNSAMPSVRPNAMLNRQRQLEGYHRMEERIRNMMRPGGSPSTNRSDPAAGQPGSPKRLVMSVRRPMHIYVLDISRSLNDGEVEWLPVPSRPTGGGPEETVFYSLVHGTSELLMFGGIQKHDNIRNDGPHYGRNMVSNQVYVVTSRHQTV